MLAPSYPNEILEKAEKPQVTANASVCKFIARFVVICFVIRYWNLAFFEPQRDYISEFRASAIIERLTHPYYRQIQS